MKQLTPEELQNNFEIFNKILDTYLSEPRKSKVKEMLDAIGEEMAVAPASGKVHYHGAYAGGYLVHVIKVITAALKVKKLYAGLGGTIDFTDEELVFSAAFHDLGKVCDGEKPTYVPQESEWHRKNQGSLYINNPKLDFMLVPQRSLYVLQKFGIQVNEKEYLAILTHDGLFEETNKPYWLSYSPDARFKSNLPRVLHTADLLAASAEFDEEQE